MVAAMSADKGAVDVHCSCSATAGLTLTTPASVCRVFRGRQAPKHCPHQLCMACHQAAHARR